MWIHVPSSVSVVGTEASSLDCEALSMLARSATWKTNSVSEASWRRVWKTVPSIRLLSGLTSPPSTQSRGVAEWISWLGASRASHIASQEASSEKTIPANSQERSLESPTGLDFQTSFLKMSPESSDSTGTPYDPNYEQWVTQLRRVSSQRQRQALLTSESASSSWPTVTQDSATPRKKKYAQGGNPLSLEATNWPTPRAAVDHMGLPRQNDRGDLQAAALARNWPTPDTQNARDGSKARKAAKGAHAVSLHHKVANWLTPAANEDRAENYTLETSQRHLDEGRQVHLAQVAKLMWPTPRASANENRTTKRPPSVQKGKHGTLLAGEAGEWAKNWPTPTGRDYKGFDPPGKQHTKSDPEMYLSIPQAPATTQDGHTCSPSCRRLNPRFAEMLLGLCQGWTDDSAPLATGLYQQWRRRLIESLRP